MYFGHGTAADRSKTPASDTSTFNRSIEYRVLALAYGVPAALPLSQRRQLEAQYHEGLLAGLTQALTAWMRGTRLDRAAFAERFFGRSADDPVVERLQSAAVKAATASSSDDIRGAVDDLAEAVKKVGVYQWARFVADAAQRARDPATVAAIEKSRQPPVSGRDAIRPVYPIETAIGIGIAAAGGGGVPQSGLPAEPY